MGEQTGAIAALAVARPLLGSDSRGRAGSGRASSVGSPVPAGCRGGPREPVPLTGTAFKHG